MKDMKRDQYLTRRTGSSNWQYKRRWPKDVAEIKSQQFLQRSLGTSDIEEARRLKVSHDAEYFSEVDRSRRKQEETAPKKPSETELMALAQRWFVEQSGEQSLFGKKPERRIDSSRHGSLVEDTKANIDGLRLRLGQGDYDTVAPLARTLIRRAGFSPELNEDVFTRFCHGLLRVQIELYAMTLAHLTGDMSYSPSDDFVQEGLRFKDPSHKTLDELIELYEKERSEGWSPSAKRKYIALFRTLREIIGGDTALHSLGREDMLRVREVLRGLPTNSQSRKETKGKRSGDVVNIARDMDLPLRSVKSVNDDIGLLSALFNYAQQSGFVDRVYTEGLVLKDPVPNKLKGRPFTGEELQAIFTSELFSSVSPARDKGEGCFWVPLMLLYHGFRTNEACQLNVVDVRDDDGIPCFVVGFNIFDDDGMKGKRVKTTASHRTIPVHPQLIRMGFLQLVELRKTEGERRLFPELKKDKDGYYSGPFSAWFSKFKKTRGVTDREAKLHAFRHNYRNALRRGGVPSSLAEALGGWSSETGAAKNYGDDSAYTLEQKLEGISQVQYECLNETLK